MRMAGFTDQRIDVPCPQCERTIRVRLRDIQQQRLVTCPGGHQVRLEEQGHGIRDMDRAMRDLDRQLKRLGGKLKFKL
jgi:hypothetical protein